MSKGNPYGKTEGFISPVGIRPWAPRAAIAPVVSGSLGEGLVVKSNGSSGCYGGWELVYPAGKTGDHFLFTVEARWHDLDHGFESLSVEAKWEDETGRTIDWAPVLRYEQKDDCILLNGTIGNYSGAAKLVIKLLLRWSSAGQVQWCDPKLVQIAPEASRPIRLGAAAARLPDGPRSQETNLAHFLFLCRQAGDQGVNLLCLPEVILSWGLPDRSTDLDNYAVTVPGEKIEPFCQVAKEYSMAICFSGVDPIVKTRNRG